MCTGCSIPFRDFNEASASLSLVRTAEGHRIANNASHHFPGACVQKCYRKTRFKTSLFLTQTTGVCSTVRQTTSRSWEPHCICFSDQESQKAKTYKFYMGLGGSFEAYPNIRIDFTIRSFVLFFVKAFCLVLQKMSLLLLFFGLDSFSLHPCTISRRF